MPYIVGAVVTMVLVSFTFGIVMGNTCATRPPVLVDSAHIELCFDHATTTWALEDCLDAIPPVVGGR